MNKTLLLICFLFLFACSDEKGLTDFEKAQAEPGWRESGLYAENSGLDNQHLSRIIGVDSKVFVKTGEGVVYTQKDEVWEKLKLPGDKKALYIQKSDGLLLVALDQNGQVFSYDPSDEEWKDLKLPLSDANVFGIINTQDGFVISTSNKEVEEDTTQLWHRMFRYNALNSTWQDITANWPLNGNTSLTSDNFFTGFEHNNVLYVATYYHDMFSYTDENGWIWWERGEKTSNVKSLLYWDESPISIHLAGEVEKRTIEYSKNSLDSAWLDIRNGVELRNNTAPLDLYTGITYDDHLIAAGGGPAIPMLKVEGRNWKRISEETMCPYVEERGERDCLGLWSAIYDMEIVNNKFYAVQAKRLIEMDLHVLDSLIQD
jgi:hypothetical protein